MELIAGRCNTILVSGPNKGKQCTQNVCKSMQNDFYCRKHVDRDAPPVQGGEAKPATASAPAKVTTKAAAPALSASAAAPGPATPKKSNPDHPEVAVKKRPSALPPLAPKATHRDVPPAASSGVNAADPDREGTVSKKRKDPSVTDREAHVPAAKKTKSQAHKNDWPPVVADLAAKLPPLPKLVLHQNAYNNWEHIDTSFVFDRVAKEIIGKQVGKEVCPLSHADLLRAQELQMKIRTPVHIPAADSS